MSQELQEKLEQYNNERDELFCGDERYSTPISDRTALLMDSIIQDFQNKVTIVWRDGSTKEVHKNEAWEFENDDNWLTSIYAY